MKWRDYLAKYWVYALVAVLPLERIPAFDLSVASRTVTIRASYIIAGMALMVFAGQLRKVAWLNWRQSFFWLALYVFVTILSSFGALSRSKSLVAIVATMVVVLTSVLVSNFASKLSLATLKKVLIGVTVGVCLFGVYQFMADMDGWPTSLTGLKPMYTKQVFGFPRIQATALEPLYLGNFLMIPLALLLSFGVIRKAQASREDYMVLGLVAAALTMTVSRGAYIAATLTIGAIYALQYRQLSLATVGRTLGTVLIGVSVGGLLIFVTSRLANDRRAVSNFVKQSTTLTSSRPGASDADRVVNRRLAKQAFSERPVLGYGIGNFGVYAEKHEPNYYGTGGSVIVNNEYLEILAETGLAGALALAGFAISLGGAAWRALGSVTDEKRWWLVALCATVIGFAVQYYAFSTLYIMHIWVSLGLLLGLTSAPQSPAGSK